MWQSHGAHVTVTRWSCHGCDVRMITVWCPLMVMWWWRDCNVTVLMSSTYSSTLVSPFGVPSTCSAWHLHIRAAIWNRQKEYNIIMTFQQYGSPPLFMLVQISAHTYVRMYMYITYLCCSGLIHWVVSLGYPVPWLLTRQKSGRQGGIKEDSIGKWRRG